MVLTLLRGMECCERLWPHGSSRLRPGLGIPGTVHLFHLSFGWDLTSPSRTTHPPSYRPRAIFVKKGALGGAQELAETVEAASPPPKPGGEPGGEPISRLVLAKGILLRVTPRVRARHLHTERLSARILREGTAACTRGIVMRNAVLPLLMAIAVLMGLCVGAGPRPRDERLAARACSTVRPAHGKQAQGKPRRLPLPISPASRRIGLCRAG